MQRVAKIVATGTILIVCAPLFASAAGFSELQAQLQSMLARITALRAEGIRGVPENGTAIQCPSLTVGLARGSRGESVAELQQFFITQKFLANDSATGYFGALTEKAVQKFQCENGLVCAGTPATTGFGTLGPRTRAAMNAACTTPSPNTTTMPIMPAAAPPIPIVDLSNLPKPDKLDLGGIGTFEDCVAVGGLVIEEAPRRCTKADDRYFLEGMPPVRLE